MQITDLGHEEEGSELFDLTDLLLESFWGVLTLP